MNPIIKALKKHALEHYDEDGWDYLIECFEDDDILRLIDGATTLPLAIEKAGRVLRVMDSRRKDVESEGRF